MTEAPSVILEDGRLRQFTQTRRTKLAGSANIAAQLDEVVHQVVATRHPVRRQIHLASGLPMQIVGVPVVGPFSEVFAVQVWVGYADTTIPPRLPVGILSLDPTSGIAHGCEISRKTENPDITGTSVLPRLLSQLDGCEDRTGLLTLMSAPAGQRWIGTATSARPIRRHLCLAARTCPTRTGPIMRVVVCDITGIQAPTPTSLDIGVLRSMPVPAGHAAGLIDLRTGLVHEWIALGPPPLDRWQCEIPQTHPDDQHKLNHCRTRLLEGTSATKCTFRIRFGNETPWTRIDARYIAVPCDGAPQALLDITLHQTD